jgi:hypothetical protein
MNHAAPRELAVMTVESGSSRPSSPAITSDLPFLKFEFDDVKEEPYVEAGTVLRTYTYRAIAGDTPAGGTLSGSAFVASPWDRTHILRIPIYARQPRSVSVAPSLLVIGDNVLDRPAFERFVRFSVIVGDPSIVDRIEVRQPEGGRLVVEREQGGSGRMVPYILRIPPGEEVAEGQYHFSIHTDSKTAPVVVPVLVQREGVARK